MSNSSPDNSTICLLCNSSTMTTWNWTSNDYLYSAANKNLVIVNVCTGKVGDYL